MKEEKNNKTKNQNQKKERKKAWQETTATVEDTRTEAQKKTLLALLCSLKLDYPDAVILGHRDLPKVKKRCPCFNAKAEYKDL